MSQKGLPIELKLTFLVALVALLVVVFFVIIAVVIYSKKQKSLLTEKRLQEAEFEKDLLAKEIEKIKSLQAERERISQDMHDDIGSSLSTIKLQALLIKKKITDVSITDDIDSIIEDANTINFSMREMIWSLQSQNDYLTNFIAYIKQYAKQFFAKTNIQFKCQSNNIDEHIPISAELRRNLFLVIKEALNNIVKHSEASDVSLNCHFTENEFSISIRDNGIGLQQNNVDGNGLLNMKNRMKAMNGFFDIESNANETSVHLQVRLATT
jgi:two-component system, NarL family, sensor histidine kinase DesK